MRRELTAGELVELEQRLRAIKEFYPRYRSYFGSVHFAGCDEEEMLTNPADLMADQFLREPENIAEQVYEDVMWLLERVRS